MPAVSPVSRVDPSSAAGPAWDPRPASMARRFGALVVDWIASVLVSSTFAQPTTQGWAPVVVLIAEYGFFLGLFGQTPGMWVTRLRCVSYLDGRAVGIPKALLRGFLLAL